MADNLQNNPTAPARLRREDREFAALTLRKQGGSYRRIAEALRQRGVVSKGYSERNAHADVIAALERQRTDRAETVEQARVLELERLDELFAKLWPKAVAGDYMAFDRVTGMMGMRARLLGLYASPTGKAEVSVADREKTVTVQLEWGDGTDAWEMHSPQPDVPADAVPPE